MDKEIKPNKAGTQIGAKEAAAAWTPFSCQISDDQKQMLRMALQSIDVEYIPVAVATQNKFDWTNYRFFCNTRVLPQAEYHAAIVQIIGSIGGKHNVTTIEKCNM